MIIKKVAMIEKKDLTDVTFLIPVRLDSVVRLENLLLVVDFFNTYFDTNIHVIEADRYENQLLKKLLPKAVQITFIEDYDPIFHRTKYINLLVKKSHTRYLGVWDTDVLVPFMQIMDSVKFLRQKEADFVYPYEKKFLDMTPILRELYMKTRNLNLLNKHESKMKKLYLPNPVGGAFLADKEAYKNAGLENECFYGWGREDGDRINRWKILDYAIKRIPGPLFHLTHERGTNSNFHSDEQDSIKMSEIKRIITMSKNELKKEIESWGC